MKHFSAFQLPGREVFPPVLESSTQHNFCEINKFGGVSKWRCYEAIILFILDDSWRCHHHRKCWLSPHTLAADVSFYLLTKAVTTFNHHWAQPIRQAEIPAQLVTFEFFLFLSKTKNVSSKQCQCCLLWSAGNVTDWDTWGSTQTLLL